MRITERIFNIIYYNLIPILIGFYLFSLLGRVKDIIDFIFKLIIFLIAIIPISIIYIFIGELIFPRVFPKETRTCKLMDKMINCKARKENGEEYCVQCPDSYVCASSIDK